jgi:broad-specificity NMP kinase
MKRFFKANGPTGFSQPVWIVSGLPRSGTSLMMMMLESAGIPPLTDHQRSADNDNPRGYYEFERVKKLRQGDKEWLQQAQGKVVKVISALLAYLPQDYHYQVLFMQRALPEILASQKKMLINRGEDPEKINDEEIAQSFKSHLAQVVDWLSNQTNFSTYYVDYNRLLKESEPEVHYINQFLGGKLDESRMLAAIDPNLYRQRK